MRPIAFDFGTLHIHWYGILMAVAYGTGFWLAGRRSSRDGLHPEIFLDLLPWLMGSAFIGARLFYVISYWKENFSGQSFWQVFDVSGGLVYYGGLIGLLLGLIIYALWKKLPLWKIGDALAPSIALGSAIGRVGCLMTGCCYGRACQLPWAISFPAGHETHPAGGSALPVHPTQIYDSLLNLMLYAALAWLYRRKKFDGQIAAVYLLCYSITRSLVEFFRGDYPIINLYAGFTPAQQVSVGIFAMGLGIYWFRSRSSNGAGRRLV